MLRGHGVLMRVACGCCMVSVAEFNFRFSARHLVITASSLAHVAQSSSCLLTQSDGANSKFHELCAADGFIGILINPSYSRRSPSAPSPTNPYFARNTYALLARRFSLSRSSYSKTTPRPEYTRDNYTDLSMYITAVISYLSRRNI